MKIIGITGGSGVGKTTVLGELEQFDTHIIDCDAVYHRLLESDAGLLGELRDRFGQTVFRDDGSLDRKALGGVVFRDANALADLNAITHKYVDAEVDGQIEAARPAGGWPAGQVRPDRGSHGSGGGACQAADGPGGHLGGVCPDPNRSPEAE